MLDCKDITLHYGQSQILNGISMSAEAGRVTCVMGVNGVGKTSLLKVLSGVHSHSGGSYRLNGAVQKMRTPSHQLAKMGARPLQRVINNRIKLPLSKKILFESLQDIAITVSYNKDKDEYIIGE